MNEKKRKFIKLAMASVGVAVVSSIAYLNRGKLNLLERQSLGGSVGNYDQYPDDPKRHWGFLIDLGRCDGCEDLDPPEDDPTGEKPRCSYACRVSHYYKYADPPQYWINVYEIEENPATGFYFFPKPCQNCQDAPCQRVCPTGATFQRKDGTILINHDICIGCRICMAACPYETRFFWYKDPVKDNVEVPNNITYSPEYPVPHSKGTVAKCDYCIHKVYHNQLPHCVTACPQGAVYFGDFNEDAVSNGREVLPLKETLKLNGGYRYKESEGTDTSVYYLPVNQRLHNNFNTPVEMEVEIKPKGNDRYEISVDSYYENGDPVRFNELTINSETSFGRVTLFNGKTNSQGRFRYIIELSGKSMIEVILHETNNHKLKRVRKNVN